jgi:hypothetical protein
MDAKARPDRLREATNPLFNTRKLKLGTFCSNLSGGCAISSIDGVLEATWPDTLALARMGDEMEFEALVPVGRWKGFAASPTSTDRGSSRFRGRRRSAPRPDIRASSPRRMCRRSIPSWPPSRPPPSTM